MIPLPKFLKKLNFKEIFRKKRINILVGITCLFIVSMVKYSGLIELILSNFTSNTDLAALFQTIFYGIFFIISRVFVGAIVEEYIDNVGSYITMTMDNGEPSQGSSISSNTEENSGPSQGSSGTGSSSVPSSSDTGSSTHENTQKGKELPEEKPSSDEISESKGKASKYVARSTRNRFISLFNKEEDFLSKQLSKLTLEESKTEDEERLNSIKEEKEELFMQMKMLRDSYLGEQTVIHNSNSEGANSNNLNKRSLEDSSEDVKESKKRDQES